MDEGEVNTFFSVQTWETSSSIHILKELQSKSNKTKDGNSSELSEDS